MKTVQFNVKKMVAHAKTVALAVVFVCGGVCGSGTAQAEDQFISIPSYRVGPYGQNGQAFYGGFVDYLNNVNMSQNGVNGVKLNATNA